MGILGHNRGAVEREAGETGPRSQPSESSSNRGHRKRTLAHDKGQPRKKPEPAAAPLTVGLAAGLTKEQASKLDSLVFDLITARRNADNAESARVSAKARYDAYLDSLTAHTE